MPRGDHRPPWQRILRQAAGWTLIAVGLVGILIPVMPQWPFLAAGALLLAPYVRIFRRFAAWLHRRFPHWRGPLRRFRDFKQRPRAGGASGGESPCQPPTGGAVSAGNDRKNGDQVARP